MTLTRSDDNLMHIKVLDEVPVKWSMAPKVLRDVVEHCLAAGAFEGFEGASVGHFGYLSRDPIWGDFLDVLLSSRRKQNYNEPEGLDLAQVYFLDDGAVQSKGGMPAAGIYSQFKLLKRHDAFDCVIHFHCPQKPDNKVSIHPQKLSEYGSSDCGHNTTKDVQFFENNQIGVVVFDKHGPNVLFKSDGNAQVVIKFIEENFELNKRTK